MLYNLSISASNNFTDTDGFARINAKEAIKKVDFPNCYVYHNLQSDNSTTIVDSDEEVIITDNSFLPSGLYICDIHSVTQNYLFSCIF